ncbi:MAG: (d)CMP kinase [Candidatus Omnitrophica bacterium]|nr:(d)CMP kinase [Candidatus Omnitrophota bacterium]
MKNNNSKRKYKIKVSKTIVSVGLSLILIFNSTQNAFTSTCKSFENTDLQVQSIFNPITEVVGQKQSKLFEIEVALILSTIHKNPKIPFHEINALLDKWYASIDGVRFLDVQPTQSFDNEGKTVVDLRIFNGTYKGTRLRLTSNKKKLEDLQKDEKNISIEIIDAMEPANDSQSIKYVDMELKRGRKLAKAAIIYTSKIQDKELRKRIINETINAYKEDTPDFVVDYADGINRVNDEMIIIREVGGPVLGYISYGKVGDTGYKIYFQYVFKKERERRVGRNLIVETIKELLKDDEIKTRWRLETTPLSYNAENLWESMFGPAAITGEKDLVHNKFVKRAHIDIRDYQELKTEPILCKQPTYNDSFVATIDGPSGTGKSTTSRTAAKRLGAVFFSYGQMYRLITMLALKEGVELTPNMDEAAINKLIKIAATINMKDFEIKEENDKYITYYERNNITDIFYSTQITDNVPYVSAIPEIRQIAVKKIRDWVRVLKEMGISIIFEGRVTGIELAPDADLKLFMSATPEVRALRRTEQLIKMSNLKTVYCTEMGVSETEYDILKKTLSEDDLLKNVITLIAKNIETRDRLDRERKHMPATIPKGAEILDSSDMSLAETVNEVVNRIELARINSLLESVLDIDEDVKNRLKVFYYKYVDMVNVKFTPPKRSFMEDNRVSYLKPEKIADLFYLYEKYNFNIWDLLGDTAKTEWVDKTTDEIFKYIFSINDKNELIMEFEPGSSQGIAEVGKATRDRFDIKKEFSGLNLGNFLIKTHYLILWAKKGIIKDDIHIAWGVEQNKLVEYYKSIGATDTWIYDGEQHAIMPIQGGLPAAILSKESASRLTGLDPFIWRYWSQRRMDRYLELVKGIDTNVLVSAQKAFSEEMKERTPEQKRSVTSGLASNFMLNFMLNNKTKNEENKINHSPTDTTKSFVPYEASSDLYELKDQMSTVVDAIGKELPASIVMDPETGLLQYFKTGKPFKAIEADVYYKEGETWDIPKGVEFPQYLKKSINNSKGALVLISGPFYDMIEGSKDSGFIRELTYEEIYKRFGLIKVVDSNGTAFRVPVLGVAGRSFVLPVQYTINTVNDEVGSTIITGKKDISNLTQHSTKVFGLEFKNAGTPAYEEHNINGMFPSTKDTKYQGEQGVFLPWIHQYGAGNPVGLGNEYGTTIPRNINALKTGGQLTRWSLATLPLETPFKIILRTPVGDYRRLSVFFNRDTSPNYENFNSIMEEYGLTHERYSEILSENYGNNMRVMIENNIMESMHGSIINSDIFGKITDLGDFWEIQGDKERYLKFALDIRIDNLVKVLNLMGDNENNTKNKALENFAKSYFKDDVDITSLSFNIEDTAQLKKAIYDHAKNIVSKYIKPKTDQTDNIKETDPKEKAAEYLITLNDNCRKMMKGLENLLFKNNNLSEPINFIIDPTLFSTKDTEKMENDITVWAYLILLYGDHDNVHFSFKNNFTVNNFVPEKLKKLIAEAPSESNILELLKLKMNALSGSFNKNVTPDEYFISKINSDTSSTAIEIPILSKEWLEFIKRENSGLDLATNQYPIAMDEVPDGIDAQTALRHFETAVTIGFSKAALAMAKNRGHGVKIIEDEEVRQLIKDTCMIARMQEIYNTVFDGKMKITEQTLLNMVDNSPRVRLNLAITMALPPMVYAAIKELQIAIHDILRAA